MRMLVYSSRLPVRLLRDRCGSGSDLYSLEESWVWDARRDILQY